MRWRIKDYIFCERQQTLTSIHGGNETTQQLEPMVVELLAYFCKNTNQIIGRSQLIETVWLGRMITDNAVNKAVTKLRKSFNDDAKKPQFIATFPKKGYKFIADVTEIIEKSSTNEGNKTANNTQASLTTKNNFAFYFSLVLIPLIVIIGVVMTWQLVKPQKTMTQVKALTRDPGRESRPQISPDGNYLAYVEIRNKKMHQWIKSLLDESIIEVNHGEDQTTWVDSLSWNSTGSHIVYLVTTPNSCQYFIRSFDNMSIGGPRLIHNCLIYKDTHVIMHIMNFMLNYENRKLTIL